MSNLQTARSRKAINLCWLLEIAGHPYRYYSGPAPDTEQIPGMSINYTDLPLLHDVPTGQNLRIDPLVGIPTINGTTLTLKGQQTASFRRESDPIVQLIRRNHPSVNQVANVTRSIGLEDASVGNPLTIYVDTDLSGLDIDSENGTLFYVHQEPFLVTAFAGSQPDPREANAYRLTAVARGAIDSNGLLKAPRRYHTSSRRVSDQPILQYLHCGNWRSRYCTIKCAIVDKRGRRVGTKNADEDPNSEYIEFLYGLINVSPRQRQPEQLVELEIVSVIGKLDSKLTFGGGVTTLATGEHYFHQNQDEFGNWHGVATYLLCGQELAGNDIRGTRKNYTLNVTADDNGDPDFNELGDGEISINDGQSVGAWQNLLDETLDHWHPRTSRALQSSNPGLIYYISAYDVGIPSLILEDALARDLDNGEGVAFPWGFEYHCSTSLDATMAAGIPAMENQPVTTLPWPQDLTIVNTDTTQGLDGAWLSVNLNAEGGEFEIIPSEETLLGMAHQPQGDAVLLGESLNRPEVPVNTCALVWGRNLNFGAPNIKWTVGGSYLDRDANRIIMGSNPVGWGQPIPKYAPLWYPIIPYAKDVEDGLFSYDAPGRRFVRNPSEGEGACGGFSNVINSRDRNSISWGMPLTKEDTQTYTCYVSEGFYQKGERYILVNDPISLEEGYITVEWYEPTGFRGDTGEVTGLELRSQSIQVSDITAVTTLSGSDKYLIELAPLAERSAESFGDWTSLPEEIWESAEVTKSQVLIYSGDNRPKILSDYVYEVLTSVNGLGIPSDRVDRESLNILDSRLRRDVFGGESWNIPAYSSKKTARDLLQGILQLARCTMGVEHDLLDRHVIVIRPADFQSLLYAKADLSNLLREPTPTTESDDRRLNRVSVSYAFDDKGQLLGNVSPIQVIGREGLASSDYEDLSKSFEVHGIDRQVLQTRLDDLRLACEEFGREVVTRWAYPRIKWKFSITLNDGLRSLVGSTVAVTSPLLESFGVSNIQPGVARVPGIVLEQTIKLKDASVELIVVAYPGSSASGYNVGFLGLPIQTEVPASLDLDTLVVIKDAANAFSLPQNQITGADQTDPDLFTPGTSNIEVYVAPVHSPSDGVSTSVTSVTDEGDYYNVVFANDIQHADDVGQTFAYVVTPLGYDDDVTPFLDLGWIADANKTLGATSAPGLTYS